MKLLSDVIEILPITIRDGEVVLAQGDEVEASVVAGEGEVALGSPLALGEATVAVGLAPIDPLRGAIAHPDRVRGPYDLAIGAAKRDADNAGLGEA